jgi:hypothetical protein
MFGNRSLQWRSEALRLYQEHSDKIDMVLTDAVMPQMGGKELVDKSAAKRFLYQDTPMMRSSVTACRIRAFHFYRNRFPSEYFLAKCGNLLDEGGRFGNAVSQ